MNDALTCPWIWLEAETTDAMFVRARREFELSQVPDSAELMITSCGLYKLWVNGEYAGRGPARSLPHRKRYDVIDVAPHLREGRNVLAVQIVRFAFSTALVHGGWGAFWCQLSGVEPTVGTDENWRLSVDKCYDVSAHRRNGNYGIIEVYDARHEEDWQALGYDDGAWQPALICRDFKSGHAGPQTSSYPRLVPRGVAQCAEDEVRPAAVVRVAEVENQEYAGDVALGWFLALDVPQEPVYTRVTGAENLASDSAEPMIVEQPSPLDQDSPNQRCATVILDFGRELSAFGRLDVAGNAGAVIDVAYGERVVAGRVQPVVQQTNYADRYILREGRQQHEVYDWKGYRYVQLTFRELTRPLKVYGVTANFYRYPLRSEGAFSCSEERVERIWAVGAYTQQLCTNDALMDTPWREQQEWLGDGRVQLLILQNAFGERRMTRQFIEHFAEAQSADGMIPCVSQRPGYYITDYALWWVQGILDVLIFDGDSEFAGRFLGNITRLFEWFEPFRNAKGLLENVPGWTFIDWANVGKKGVCAPLNAIYCMALEAAAAIARSAECHDLEASWSQQAAELRRVWASVFWDAGRALYVDNVVGGQRQGRYSQHTQSLAVLAGLHGDDDAELMARTLSWDGIVKTEPYFSFYLVEALGRVGMADKALALIRDRWGAMLEGDATSFWEEWQVTGTFRDGRWLARPRSHCHAWSAAPTAWLSRYVLGVRRDDPDGPTIVEPQVCGLARACGTVPTVDGPVVVSWEVCDDCLNVEVRAPVEAWIECREPATHHGACRFDVRRS